MSLQVHAGGAMGGAAGSKVDGKAPARKSEEKEDTSDAGYVGMMSTSRQAEAGEILTSTV